MKIPASPGLQAICGFILAGVLFLRLDTARAQEDYGFIGGVTLETGYGTHPTSIYNNGYSTPDGYAYNSSGSFGVAADWSVNGYPNVSGNGSQSVLNLSPSGPGADDNVSIGGLPAGDLPLVQGPPNNSDPDNPVYGYLSYSSGAGGDVGYDGGAGFNVTGAGGEIGSLFVDGPGTLEVDDLSVANDATIESIGGIGLYSVQYEAPFQFLGYAPSYLTITGDSLSADNITLTAGTNLQASVGETAPDPVADAGSLTIDAKLEAIQSIFVSGVPTSPANALSESQIYRVAPITVTGGALLQADTFVVEGVDYSQYPNVQGYTSIVFQNAGISASNIVIGTDAEANSEAEVRLEGGGIVAYDVGDAPPSLIVGDTGEGVLTALDQSEIQSQQTVVANEADSTGLVTISNSTWKNESFLSIGYFGDGTVQVNEGGSIESDDTTYVGLYGGSLGTLTLGEEASGSSGTAVLNTSGINGPNALVVATEADSYGTVSLMSPDSTLTINGDLQIGYYGTGYMNLSEDTTVTVTGDLVRLGHFAGGDGTLTVNGSGASFTAEDATFTVGQGGMGTATIEDGASLQVQQTDIGNEAGSSGTLTIDGVGTMAELGTSVTVGDAGYGQLNITGGAQVESQNQTNVLIGNASTGTGIVTVSGEGSSWTIDGSLAIGVDGNGTLSIEDGDTVDVTTEDESEQGSVILGQDAGSIGTLMVNGSGSELHLIAASNQTGNEPVMIIGQDGTGNLIVQDGANVELPETALGTSATGRGTITVQGSQETTVEIDGLLDIGQVSTGNSVSVVDGGVLMSEGAILGDQAGSSGSATIDGQGSLWKLTSGGPISGALIIGNSGTGTYTISGQAQMTANTVALGQNSGGNGTLNITGSGDEGGQTTFSAQAPMTIGGSGAGMVSATDGGQLITGSSVVLGAQAGSSGTVNLTGMGTTWDANGGYAVTVGQSGSGSLTLSGGASMTGQAMIVGAGSGSASVSVGTGSTLQLAQSLVVDGSGTSGATFRVLGNASIVNSLTIGPSGLVSTSGGGVITLGATGGGGSAPGLIYVGSNSTLTDNGTLYGNLSVAQGGLVDGIGTLNGNALNNGIVMPGDDPGTFTINGDFMQGPTGKLIIEVAGTAPGSPTGYSVFDVTGNATLGGKIQLSYLNGFKPTPGQTLNFLSVAGSTTGSFSGVSVTGLLTDDVTDSFTGSTVTIDTITPDFATPTLMSQLTPNQRAVGTSLNSVVTGATGDLSTLLTSINNLDTAQQIGAAYDQLSPERLGLFRNIAFDNFAFASQQLDDHLASLRDGLTGLDTSGLSFNDSAAGSTLSQIRGRLLAWNPAPETHVISDIPNQMFSGVKMTDESVPLNKRWSAFIDGNVVLADLDANADVSHANYTTGGVTVGADYRLDRNWTMGALFGYNHTDATLDEEGSSAKVATYSPGIYAAYADRGWYANGSFNYSYNSYSENRNIIFPGTNRTAVGTPDGDQYATDFDGGYEFHLGDWTIGPSAGLEYVHLDISSFSESGAGVAGLNVQDQSDDSLRSRIGFDTRWNTKYMSTDFTYHLSAHWQHEFMDNDLGIASALQTPGFKPFTVSTASPDRDSALIDTGVDAQVANCADVFIDYQAQAGQSDFFAQSVQGGVKIGF